MPPEPEEEILDIPENVLSPDPSHFTSAAWSASLFGYSDSAPESFAFLESQPLEDPEQLHWLHVHSPNELSPASGSMWTASQAFPVSMFPPPDIDNPALDTGPPKRDLTAHQLSSGPSQGPSKRRDTNVSGDTCNSHSMTDTSSSPCGGDSSDRATLTDKTRPSSLAADGEASDNDQDTTKVKAEVVDDADSAENKETSDEKRLRKNRVAATRCRRNKKQANAILKAQEAELRSTNENLNADASRLRNEVFDLKNELLQHGKCDNKPISDYIDREAAKLN